MKLIGMNCGLMKQYIEFVADRLMLELGFTKVTCTRFLCVLFLGKLLCCTHGPIQMGRPGRWQRLSVAL